MENGKVSWGYSAPYLTNFFQNTSAVCLGTSEKFGGIEDVIYYVLVMLGSAGVKNG